MEPSTERYLKAVAVMRDRAKDEYDHIWWKIEFDTVSAGIGLTATNLHKRVMRALRSRRGRFDQLAQATIGKGRSGRRSPVLKGRPG